jgi:hypothetical protein
MVFGPGHGANLMTYVPAGPASSSPCNSVASPGVPTPSVVHEYLPRYT